MNYIIEGIDNLGKSTLIDYIEKVEGFKFKIHYGQPKKIIRYESLEEYAFVSIDEGFYLLENNENIIFDRFHLGEVVYSDIYRDYKTDFVFELESDFVDLENKAERQNTTLILLLTNNFDNIIDDGKSINHNNSKLEQTKFIRAYYKSQLNKKFIFIDDIDGNRKTTEEIYAEIKE